MEFTNTYNDLMYGALDVFLESDSPHLIAHIGGGIEFTTKLGHHGFIEKNEIGDWDINLEGSLVYTIEKEVFEIITRQEKAPALDNLIIELSDLYQKELGDRSKILLENIIQGIGYLMINGKAKADVDVQFGPYFIKSNGDGGQIIMN